MSAGMTRLLFAMIAAASLFFSPQEKTTMQDPVYTITIDPDPLKAGKSAKITYSGPIGTTLTLDWDPSGEPSSVVIDEKGEATFTVPAAATSLVVSDPWDNSEATTVDQ
jgi:hypothetical protein